jgi:hypothetical protein
MWKCEIYADAQPSAATARRPYAGTPLRLAPLDPQAGARCLLNPTRL